MQPVEVIDYKGLRLEIYPDEDAANPRHEFDNFGTMICFHRHYDLGDKNVPYRSSDFDSWGDLLKALIDEQRVEVAIPLFLYDHSGITIRGTSAEFRACDPQGWDWGIVGFIYVTREQIQKEYSCKYMTKKVLAQAEKLLRSEIEIYDMYLTGDVWGYVVKQYVGPESEDEDEDYWNKKDDDNWEEVNWGSCWGFYGMKYCIEAAKEQADWELKHQQDERDRIAAEIAAMHQKLFVENIAVGL